LTNAIIERKGLARVGDLRLGALATKAYKAAGGVVGGSGGGVEDPSEILPRGVKYGGRSISPFDEGTQVR